MTVARGLVPPGSRRIAVLHGLLQGLRSGWLFRFGKANLNHRLNSFHFVIVSIPKSERQGLGIVLTLLKLFQN